MRIFPLEIGRHCLLPEAKIVLEYGRESLDSVDLECVVLGGYRDDPGRDGVYGKGKGYGSKGWFH